MEGDAVVAEFFRHFGLVAACEGEHVVGHVDADNVAFVAH